MGHIKEFDGLRGVLAGWVFVAHAIELGPFSSIAGHLRPQYAVDVFIILSGFVIFELLSRGEDYGVFIVRRFFRLFPVFAVCFLFALVLRGVLHIHDEVAFGFVGNRPLKPYLVAHATMLHGLVPEQILPESAEAILPPAWSISLEWQFYLVAPLLFWFVLRPGWKPALALVALVGVRVLAIRHSVGLLLPGAPRDLTFNMSAFLPLKLEFFAAGALSWMVWRAFVNGRIAMTSRRLALSAAGALLLMIATESLALALWIAGFALLLHARFNGASRAARRFSRFFAHRVPAFFGVISYSLYLVHVPTVVAIRQLLVRALPAMSPAAFAVTLIALAGVSSVLLATLLHLMVEKPMMAFAKRVTARWSVPMTTPIAPAA